MQRRAALASLLLCACSAERRHAALPPERRRVARAPGPPAPPKRDEHALFARFPGIAASLPRVRLATLPSPVQSVPELASRLGLSSFWLKRDDRTATGYGGNKVRKLEHFLGAALRARHTSVLTFGGVGSNHALATAVHARRVGLSAILLLLPQARSASVRHHLLAASAAGAELHLARSIDEHAAARPYLARNPYLIPTGGTAPLGDAGLVNAAFELAAQVASSELAEPDEIWVALGTAGTAAGLALGLAAAGLRSRLVAVRVSSPRYGIRELERAFTGTRELLRSMDASFPDVQLDPGRVRVVEDFAAPGYGVPSRRGREALAVMRELAGVELDDTYTAKTFAAMIAFAPEIAGKNILFYDSYDARRIAPPGAAPALVPEELRGFVR